MIITDAPTTTIEPIITATAAPTATEVISSEIPVETIIEPTSTAIEPATTAIAPTETSIEPPTPNVVATEADP